MRITKLHKGIRPAGPGEWLVTARLRVNGKIRHRQKTVTGTIQEAQALFENLKKALREGTPAGSLTDQRARTFGDLLQAYIDRRPDVSPSHLRKFRVLRNDLGQVYLADFTERFERYLKIGMETKVKYKDHCRGPSWYNRNVEIARAAFRFGVTLGIVNLNPVSKERFPRRKEIARDRILTAIERQNLLNVIEHERPYLAPAVKFLLTIPTRVSECVNMRVNDLDLFNSVIRVRNGQTKNDAGTWKPIPPDLRDYFRTLPGDTEFLFFRRDRDGVCRPLGAFRRAWKYCLKQAGISDYRVHDTRHEAATGLIDAGTPEQVVMTVAGWKTNMLRTYYHREPKKALELVRYPVQCEGNVKAGKVAEG